MTPDPDPRPMSEKPEPLTEEEIARVCYLADSSMGLTSEDAKILRWALDASREEVKALKGLLGECRPAVEFCLVHQEGGEGDRLLARISAAIEGRKAC